MTGTHAGPIRLVLPATSANLGPGFDALGLAMGLSLRLEASVGEEYSIDATGRNADLCGRITDNLILDTYIDVVTRAGKPVLPLQMILENEIPLGMGCGSSAAALLAGVLLANHFGEMGGTGYHCMEEACRREGHPDNVAACALGFMTVSSSAKNSIVTATCGESLPWKLLLALPSASLATEKARALLPAEYSRADAVLNIQRTALLVAAFSLGRGELLRVAMEDRIHQPYRMAACPLLPKLLPLAGQDGVLGVALSGAGPGVLLILDANARAGEVIQRVRLAAGDPALEIVETAMGSGGLQRSGLL